MQQGMARARDAWSAIAAKSTVSKAIYALIALFAFILSAHLLSSLHVPQVCFRSTMLLRPAQSLGNVCKTVRFVHRLYDRCKSSSLSSPVFA